MENQLIKKLNAKIDIDFSKKSIKIYAFIPIGFGKDNGCNLFNQRTIINLRTGEKQQLIIGKIFEISEDYNSITIDGTIYEIPAFFNRESMKLNDTKTWEMIFYQIFNTDIHKELNQYKQLIEKSKKAEKVKAEDKE